MPGRGSSTFNGFAVNDYSVRAFSQFPFRSVSWEVIADAKFPADILGVDDCVIYRTSISHLPSHYPVPVFFPIVFNFFARCQYIGSDA